MIKTLEAFIADMPAYLAVPARILLILVLAGIALRLIPRLLAAVHKAVKARQGNVEDSRRIETLSRVVRYGVTVLVTVVTGILILGEFGVSVAPILGAAGVVGIAIGFGAQSLVKDYFAGFFLLLENQIRVDDVVEIGDKSGVVEELTLRYLRLRDYSGNVHFVPNGSISIVTNMTLGFAYAVANIRIAYDADVDGAVQIMRRVGEEMRQSEPFARRILDPIEIAGVDHLGESEIVILCRFKVTPTEQWSVRREFLRRIKIAFDANGIDIPFRHIQLVAPGTKPV